MVKWRWKPILDKESDKKKKDSKDKINKQSKHYVNIILKFKYCII